MRNLVVILSFCTVLTQARQVSRDTLLVSVNEFPPFIIFSGGEVSGFEIDLWNEIARGLGQPFHWESTGNLAQVFNQVKSGKADIGLAGVTITSDRENDFDFSHSYYTTGLNALVLNQHDQAGIRFFKSVFTPRVKNILLAIVVFIVLCSHLIWFFERGQDAFHDSYFPGIFEGAWWTIVTMSTVGYGDIAPKKWAGRLIAVFVILMGITFFGIAVAELSSSFTKEHISAKIQTVQDLKNEKVVVVSGTTSEQEVLRLGHSPHTVPDIKTAFHKLESHQVKAFIYDEPALRWHMKKNPGKFRLLESFNAQPYGLLFKSGNTLREKVNREILKIKESGRYKTIYNKWFDSDR